MVVEVLGPKGSRAYRDEFKVFELMQGSLPERRYYATATFEGYPRPIADLPAGTLDLWRPSTIDLKPLGEGK